MISIEKNVSLAKYTTFGIGGPADFFVTAHSAEELKDAVQWAYKRHVTFFVLGSGANILVGDKGFRGLVIKNEAKNVFFEDDLLTAESGAVIADLISVTSEKGLSGFEHFAGIPSTVGGALWQNLHFLSPDRTHTVYIGEIVDHANILTQDNWEEKIVGRDYFSFGYDASILHSVKDIVLSASFRLTQSDPKTMHEQIKKNIAWREEKHPDYAWRVSAGSVFKKIEGYGAGRLIEQVGLKGHKIGGAQISLKHANFIVNTGGATAQDVRALIDLIQETVKNKLNLSLITEINFVGEF